MVWTPFIVQKNVYDPVYGNPIFGSHFFGDLETIAIFVANTRQFFKVSIHSRDVDMSNLSFKIDFQANWINK